MKFAPVLLLLLLSPARALAQPTACEGRELNVGVSLLGAAYFVRDGRAQGIDVDIAKELARRTGMGYRFIDMNRRRISLSLEQGQFIDMSGIVGRLPERDRHADFFPLHRAPIYLLVQRRLAREDGYRLQDFMRDPRLRMGSFVGATTGLYGDAQLERLAAQQRLLQSAQTKHAMAMLLAGRVDGMLATVLVFGPSLREPAAADAIRVIAIPEADALVSGMYLSRERLDPACRQRLLAALQGLLKDGTLRRIYERHLGPELRRGQIELLAPARPRRG